MRTISLPCAAKDVLENKNNEKNRALVNWMIVKQDGVFAFADGKTYSEEELREKMFIKKMNQEAVRSVTLPFEIGERLLFRNVPVVVTEYSVHEEGLRVHAKIEATGGILVLTAQRFGEVTAISCNS